ncbi:MAG TPA: hypothetical protein VIW24_03090 [Aldersonia sp.]
MTDQNEQPPSQPPPPRPAPQRVGPAAQSAQPKPKPKRGKWLAAVVVAGLAIVALAVAAVLLVREQNKGPTPEEQVRASIDTYVQALTTGDLAALRTTTCGTLADYYRTIPDAEFAQVHDAAVVQKALPVVQSVDAVQITETTAIAQVTAYTQAEPTPSARTFDLQQTPEGTWLVCSPAT